MTGTLMRGYLTYEKSSHIMIACGERRYAIRYFWKSDGEMLPLVCKRWFSLWKEVDDKDYCSGGAKDKDKD